MKHLILSAFVFFAILSTASAQELSTKSKQELEQIKDKAVKEQNYELAEKVKVELQSRKTIDELIAEKKSQLDAAVKNGEYAKAEEIKKEVARLEKTKIEIKTLEEQLNTAIKQENYAEAQRLKQEIAALKNPGADAQKPATAQNTQKPEKNSTEANTPTSGISSKLSFLSGYKATIGFTGGDIIFTDDTGNGMEAEFGPTMGYMIGLAKDLNMGEYVTIQPGIGLVGFGSKVVDADYTYNIHYLSLHANGIFRSPFKVYAGAGLFLDYGLFGSQGYPSGESNNIFESGGFGRLNTGLNIELGYAINTTNVNGDVFFSYRVGMNNVEGDDASEGQTTKLRMFTIGLKYAL